MLGGGALGYYIQGGVTFRGVLLFSIYGIPVVFLLLGYFPDVWVGL